MKTLTEALSALEDSQGGLADEAWPLENAWKVAVDISGVSLAA